MDAGTPLTRSRESHAVLDVEARRKKALKIQRLIEDHRSLSGADVLDVGTGSGVNAVFMSRAVGEEGSVVSVDVVDERQEREGYRFVQVGGPDLPFDDDGFDVVISNHVIEHVGPTDAQRRHLAELRRVMKRGGILYLATPNRWALVEPHFDLPFLSWVPQAWRRRYVRIAGRGQEYDCFPLTRSLLWDLLGEEGFLVEDLTVAAIGAMREAEPSRSLVAAADAMPDTVLRVARPLIPTIVILARTT